MLPTRESLQSCFSSASPSAATEERRSPALGVRGLVRASFLRVSHSQGQHSAAEWRWSCSTTIDYRRSFR
eukprot:6199648-Pleurochrysis_carterae.AAC.2